MKHHFIYQTTNLVNNKFYLGMHSTNNLEDDYLGSGLNLQRSIKKYGLSNFERTIIVSFDNREDLIEMEKLLITEDLIKSYECYNIATGGQGGYLGEEALEKSRNANTGKTWSEETKQKMSIAKLNKFKGKESSRFKGYWITPKGKFESSRLAAEANNTTHMTVQRRCLNKKLTDWNFESKEQNEDNS